MCLNHYAYVGGMYSAQTLRQRAQRKTQNAIFSLPSFLSLLLPCFYFLFNWCLYSLNLCQPLIACNVLQLYTSILVSCVLGGFGLGILSFGVFSTQLFVGCCHVFAASLMLET